MIQAQETVVVAMSGGVDSSVAALLLKQQGYRVIGMTLKTWPKELCDTTPKGQTCCSTRDIQDARVVAHKLGIPFYVVEAAQPFQSEVMDYFVDAYASGVTPNPCVVCNRKIKCGLLLEKARALGAKYVATGHYARKVYNDDTGRYAIQQAVDADKDQSYVLFQLPQTQLESLLLPVGDFPKQKIRDLAIEAGLHIAEKPESMELCFIPDGDTQKFLKERVPQAFTPGDMVNTSGEVLGQHQGIAAYTIGQRKGLGLAFHKPLYVLKIDPENNRVIVGEEHELAATTARVAGTHWMTVDALESPMDVSVKIRYKSAMYKATLEPQDDAVRVQFHHAVEGGVPPGQAAVFYQDDVVVGGGWFVHSND